MPELAKRNQSIHVVSLIGSIGFMLPVLLFLPAGQALGQAVQYSDTQQDEIDTDEPTPEELFHEYRDRYASAAQQVAQNKRRDISADALAQLRKQGLGVIRGGGLGKKKIKETLNPAVDRLNTALVPTLIEAAEEDEGLDQLRQSVIDAGIPQADLKHIERVVSLYILCENERSRRVISENLKLRDDLSKAEADAIDICNLRRLLLGLGPLKIDMKLIAASRDHSKDMVEHKFFSHTSPVDGKKKFTKRASNFGTSASAENIAKGYSGGLWLIRGWWNSPGHLKNMMGGHNRVGVGQHKKHFTMMLG